MLQLHNLLLVSSMASTPADVPLAVATKCHYSQSLRAILTCK